MMEDVESFSKSDSVDSSVDSEIDQDESKSAPKEDLREVKLLREGPIVIMPLDASKHSLYCLTFYIKYIHKPENKIHVCYVAEDYRRRPTILAENEVKTAKCGGWCSCIKGLMDRITIMDTMGPSPGIAKELEREDRISCQWVKAKVKSIFTSNDIKSWDFKRLTGEDPWTAILDYREQMGGTMIVLGSRSLGMIKRTIFGSVSDKVLHKSSVPVLVVRIPYGALSMIPDAVTGSSFIC